MVNLIIVWFGIIASDVLINSGVAAYLQRKGWDREAQVVNDLVQAWAFLFGAILHLYVFDSYWLMALSMVHWVCYIEDTLFYAILNIINPHRYQLPIGGYPERISGWLGFLNRHLWDKIPNGVSFHTALILNGVIIVFDISLVILVI